MEYLYEKYGFEYNVVFVGDGRFDGDTSDSNYMEVVAGFSRMIFYFGIIGLISIVIFHYRLKEVWRM